MQFIKTSKSTIADALAGLKRFSKFHQNIKIGFLRKPDENRRGKLRRKFLILGFEKTDTRTEKVFKQCDLS